MEFKTLKDIDNFETEQITKYISILQQANCFKPKEKREVIAWLTHQMKLFDLIKQEAIKWVKDFQKERTDAITEMFDNQDDYGIYPTTKFFNRIDKFWMEKFNIKKEDLK